MMDARKASLAVIIRQGVNAWNKYMTEGQDELTIWGDTSYTVEQVIVRTTETSHTA
jgi:hypothetical protein